MAISTIVHRAMPALVLWLLPLSAFASGVAIVTALQGRTTLNNADCSAEAAILSDVEAGSQAQSRAMAER